MRLDVWTEQELTILRDNYSTKGASGCAPLLPRRTLDAIQTRARILGLKVPHEVKRDIALSKAKIYEGRWTPAEDAIIVRLCGKVTYEEMCKELPGRTPRAINCRANKLGFGRSSWSEEEDQILRENYHEGAAYVAKLLPNRSLTAIYSRALKYGLHGSRAEKEIAWTEKEIALLKQYGPMGLKACMKMFPHRTEASVSGKARSLGIPVFGVEPIVIDGIAYRSVRQVILKYNFQHNKVYALAREHSVSVVEAVKKCAAGEWDGYAGYKHSIFSGNFGASGELKVKSTLDSFPGMALYACSSCNSVHLIPDAEVEFFRCELDGERTLYPAFCFVPHQFKKTAERAGIMIKHPGMRQYKL